MHDAETHDGDHMGAQQLGAAIAAEVGKAIIGQDQAVRLLTVALLAGGHVLLEGPPGVAKTFLAQCFARATGLDFGRIQFTPDL
ncbi:AAA family ATPase, partial [Sandarakinorhabdus sp.]|uniref:AAA family ATPase n=1 Tax=Sandarakinorhabdus sp. TaxID=1916663 RepID=UPI0038F73A2D